MKKSKYFAILCLIFVIFAFCFVGAGCNLNNVTITFETNGASQQIEDVIIKKGSSEYNLPTPTREFYNFEGWCTDKALTQLIPEGFEISSDIVLYAKYSLMTDVSLYDSVVDLVQCSLFFEDITDDNLYILIPSSYEFNIDDYPLQNISGV